MDKKYHTMVYPLTFATTLRVLVENGQDGQHVRLSCISAKTGRVLKGIDIVKYRNGEYTFHKPHACLCPAIACDEIIETHNELLRELVEHVPVNQWFSSNSVMPVIERVLRSQVMTSLLGNDICVVREPTDKPTRFSYNFPVERLTLVVYGDRKFVNAYYVTDGSEAVQYGRVEKVFGVTVTQVLPDADLCKLNKYNRYYMILRDIVSNQMDYSDEATTTIIRQIIENHFPSSGD